MEQVDINLGECTLAKLAIRGCGVIPGEQQWSGRWDSAPQADYVRMSRPGQHALASCVGLSGVWSDLVGLLLGGNHSSSFMALAKASAAPCCQLERT